MNSYNQRKNFRSAPVEQDLVPDLRKLNKEERHALLQGPTVDIFLSGKKIYSRLPKRAFMATSQDGQETFKVRPAAVEVLYNADQLQEFALIRIFDFIKGNCYTSKPFNLKPDHDMLNTLEIYRAGLHLFKSDLYLHGVHQQIIDWLESGAIPSFAELTVIAKIGGHPCKTRGGDRLFKFATSLMSSYRHQGLFAAQGDDEALDSFLEKHTAFAKSMDEYAGRKEAQREQRRLENQAHRLQRQNSRAARPETPMRPPTSVITVVRDLRKPSKRPGYKKRNSQETSNETTD